jgi:hypothetical protein
MGGTLPARGGSDGAFGFLTELNEPIGPGLVESSNDGEATPAGAEWSPRALRSLLRLRHP